MGPLLVVAVKLLVTDVAPPAPVRLSVPPASRWLTSRSPITEMLFADMLLSQTPMFPATDRTVLAAPSVIEPPLGAPVKERLPEEENAKLSFSSKLDRKSPPVVLITAPAPTEMLPFASTKTRPVEVRTPLITAVSNPAAAVPVLL